MEQAKLEWLETIEAAAKELEGASAEEQEGTCAWFEEEWGEEAGKKLRELLAAGELAETRRREAIAAAEEAEAFGEPLFILPEVQPREESEGDAQPKAEWAVRLAAMPDGDGVAAEGLKIVAEGVGVEEVAAEVARLYGDPAAGEEWKEWARGEPKPLEEIVKGPKPSPETVREIEAEEEDYGKEAPGVLNSKAPLDNARKLMRLRNWNVRTNNPTLAFWQKQFWEWLGTHWQVVDDDTMRSRVYRFLDEAEKEIRRNLLTRFEPGREDVNKTIDALRATANLEPGMGMPGWFGGAAPVENLMELVACQNGLLYMPKRELLKHTPRFWSPNVLEYRYEPRAKCPRWEQFLEEVFPGDVGAQMGLMEMIGLCLTDETKYQKAFMFVGPRRGGRGTIGRVLKGLVGEANYVGTTLDQLFKDFGMQNWIGKKVAVFTDEGLDGISKAQLGLISGRLKKVTGEDEQSINRKFLGYWEGTLRTRVVIFSNELLKFHDTSGAVAGRFINWRMKESFKDREDPDLTRKLLAERPGILNMALDALDRLRIREKFLQHESGEEMAQSLENMTSDVMAFVGDECDIGPNKECFVLAMFNRWSNWCSDQGIRYAWAEPQFSEKLRAAVPTINSGRPRRGGRGRPTVLFGIAPRRK